MKDVRPETKWFAAEMEKQLKANDHKGGWQDCDIWWLFKRLDQEKYELVKAIMNLEKYWAEPLSPLYAAQLIKEAADVANFAMMIADIARSSERSVIAE